MTVDESVIRDILRLIVWYPFRWLIYCLPVPVSLFLYRRMGDIHYLVSKKKRDLIARNLKRAFRDRPLNELHKIARRNMQTHYTERLLVFLFLKLNKHHMDRMVSIEGQTFIDEALAKGKGCILLHGHYGPAQLSLCALGHKGYRMNQLGLRTTEGISFIGRRVQANIRLGIEERRIPARMLYANKFMRPTFNALRKNEVLLTAGDAGGNKRFIGKYVSVPFLGNRMYFPTGWVSLAKRTGASVLPLSLYPDGSCKYRVVLGPPFDLQGEGNAEDKNLRAIKDFAEHLEEDVRKAPEQWHYWDDFHEGNLLA